ncbi:MAG TPA: hypothetical protein VMU26_14055 [Candidatus Polarisedimenticolia bacterium]|nr:hypothetical protein [Candidatus Polarisedimenticolia bacterium]
MSTKPSEQMMDLLKELALLKGLDQKYDAGSRTDLETTEFEGRQSRRREISDQIKELAEPARLIPNI